MGIQEAKCIDGTSPQVHLTNQNTTNIYIHTKTPQQLCQNLHNIEKTWNARSIPMEAKGKHKMDRSRRHTLYILLLCNEHKEEMRSNEKPPTRWQYIHHRRQRDHGGAGPPLQGTLFERCWLCKASTGYTPMLTLSQKVHIIPHIAKAHTKEEANKIWITQGSSIASKRKIATNRWFDPKSI